MRLGKTFTRKQCASFLLIAAMALPAALADVGIAPGQGVSLSQNVYYDDTSNNAPVVSVYGTIGVNVATLNATTSLGGGYLNVNDGGDWVVQNLPVSTLLGNVSTSFVFTQFSATNPSNGGIQTSPSPVSSTEPLTVDYTSAPVQDFYPNGSPYIPPSQTPNPNYPSSPYPYPNNQMGYAFCGQSSDGTTYPPPSNTPPSNQILAIAMANGIMPAAPAMPNVAEAIPNLNAADQQCVPAAFANDLLYLSAKYNVVLPAADVGNPGRFGLLGGVANFYIPTGVNQEGPPLVQNEVAAVTLVGKLDQSMNRFNAARSPNPAANAGVPIGAQLSGLTSYIATAGLSNKIGILTQGVDSTKTPFANNGVAVTVFNSQPTFQFIYNALAAGDSVEGAYFYGGANGHAVDITAAGIIPAGAANAGTPFIDYSSDWVQTGNLDPLDTILTPAGTNMVHESLVIPSAGTILGTDGLWLPGEANVGGQQALLTDLTVMYFIPEPGCLLILMGAIPLMRRRSR